MPIVVIQNLLKFQCKYLKIKISALSRPHDESLPAEELDGIQLELEQLLSAVALRQRHLKTEFESLDREDRRQKKGIYGSEKQSNSPNHTGKRKRDDKKASKDNKYFGNQQPKLSKLKTSSSHSPAHSLHTDDSMDATPYLQGTHPSSTRVGDNQNPKLLLPKNDIPNKFWLSVEPYCMPITQEDIKVMFPVSHTQTEFIMLFEPFLMSTFCSYWMISLKNIVVLWCHQYPNLVHITRHNGLPKIFAMNKIMLIKMQNLINALQIPQIMMSQT